MGLFHRFAGQDSVNESAGKGVAGADGVDDFDFGRGQV